MHIVPENSRSEKMYIIPDFLINLYSLYIKRKKNRNTKFDRFTFFYCKLTTKYSFKMLIFEPYVKKLAVITKLFVARDY